jgi:hypothetical protein
LLQEAARLGVRAEQRPHAVAQIVIALAGLREPLVPLVRRHIAHQLNKNVFGLARLGGHSIHHWLWLHNVMRRREPIRPEIEKRFFWENPIGARSASKGHLPTKQGQGPSRKFPCWRVELLSYSSTSHRSQARA